MTYICENDGFTQEREEFDTVEDFLDMCRFCFGKEPQLRRRNGDEFWTVDERGNYTGTSPVLREQ